MDRKTKIDTALKLKEEGNAAFKASDLPLAMKKYHSVVMYLKGLQANTGLPFGIPNKTRSTPARASISEIPDGEQGDEKEEGDESQASQSTSKQTEESQKANEPEDETYSDESIKRNLTACYVNMAIVSAKQEKWSAAKRHAEEALKVDPENHKAAFRKGQAHLRMGEITLGKKQLEELAQKSDDVAVRNELKILQATEKEREQKYKQSFRGFMNKNAPPAMNGAKIQELPDDAHAPAGEAIKA